MRESALLEHIYRTAADSAAASIPPGDDMGAMTVGGAQVLVTVDQLADQVHADLQTMALDRVARKAVTRNLSDVAAMAARPSGAVVAATLPQDFGESRATHLFDAMKHVAERFECPLIGGDIGLWPHALLLSVTVFAEPAGIEPVRRSGARVGDAVYVSGALGGSLETVDGYCHHLDFTPRINLARALAGQSPTRPHAMIDLSDGLGRDLTRLCQASGVSATIDAERLPISDAARQASEKTGLAPWRHAVADGEDYELLFTAPPGSIPRTCEGVELHQIGTLIEPADQPAATLSFATGQTIDLAHAGWEHASA